MSKKALAAALGGLILASLVAVLVLSGILNPFSESRETAIEQMLASEELFQESQPLLGKLRKSALNLQLPDHNSRFLFADRVELMNLAGDSNQAEVESLPSLDLKIRSWPVEDGSQSVLVQDLKIQPQLFSAVEYFDHAKFFFVDARFSDASQTRWETTIGFEGMAKTKTGSWQSIRSRQRVIWENELDSDEEDNWKIVSWHTLQLVTLEIDRLPWQDRVNSALPRELDRDRATTSAHEILVTQFLYDRQVPPNERTFLYPHPYFQPPSQDRHPAISVVDIDSDGFDDFYVMARWGKNLLFRNRGDGTFEEIAEKVGLDIQDHTASAAFADFDNDGDPDVFIGRTLARSQYLENRDGKFFDMSMESIGTPLPYLVSSISCADFNQDGLLDVYFSTYAADIVRDAIRAAEDPTVQSRANRDYEITGSGSLLEDFLSPEDARHYYTLLSSKESDYHAYRNDYGPPNLLLQNDGGGRFSRGGPNTRVGVFRQSYQASWCDYDNDGDPDLYVANDFAPNNLFRNDPNHDFVDVTSKTQTEDIGFGMGISWGDYDNDGWFDLYVSNMFSKAGLRITDQVPGLNPIFRNMARGNSLLRNVSGKFERVSGRDDSTLLVEEAGWSWGSQFADLDNDGWLDIYALSGFYTAPSAVESQVDI